MSRKENQWAKKVQGPARTIAAELSNARTSKRSLSLSGTETGPLRPVAAGSSGAQAVRGSDPVHDIPHADCEICASVGKIQ
jgi:hypothetical protein